MITDPLAIKAGLEHDFQRLSTTGLYGFQSGKHMGYVDHGFPAALLVKGLVPAMGKTRRIGMGQGTGAWAHDHEKEFFSELRGHGIVDDGRVGAADIVGQFNVKFSDPAVLEDVRERIL